MPIAARIKPNLYKDSVALMRVSQRVLEQPGVQRATLVMGTPANKDMLAQAGLFRAEFDLARPSDLMIVIEAETPAAIEAAQVSIAGLLDAAPTARSGGAETATPARSIALAVARGAHAALAQISVPGPYAAAEAMKALKLGMHAFVFSDNVPLDEERALKALAARKGLLMMGPDCGTAIIRGVPLGFANIVHQGAIGLVGASGTGLQEVMCRIDAMGQGISHAIGTGSRDVTEAVGGTTMCQAIDLLAADSDTRVIGIVSKPPAAAVARKVLEHAERAGKPCVVLFLGADWTAAALPTRVVPVATLYDAAVAAVALVNGAPFEPTVRAEASQRVAEAEARGFAPSQRLVHGLYSGGTFCMEAQLVWRQLGMHVRSNAPLEGTPTRDDGATSESHSAIDFGADEFTIGRPHPMIDTSTRTERLPREARDPAVAALVVDVVLGYGSHPDPAGALAPAIAQARAIAADDGRHLPVVTFVCGTEEDPQRLSVQQAKLREAGAIVVADSTTAARLAGAIAIEAGRARTGRREFVHSAP